MDKSLENNDWKKEAPNLAALPVNHPFSVPEGYFDDLSPRIKSNLYLQKLKESVNESGFNTPENYFDTLHQQINAEVAVESLKSIVPLKESATVPPNYFEKLQADILAKTVHSKTGEKVTKISKLWHSRILKYASAACFVMISTTGLYLYQQQQLNTKIAYSDLATDQMLYEIDEQMIIDHIENNNLHQSKSPNTDVALENYILNNYTQSDIASDL